MSDMLTRVETLERQNLKLRRINTAILLGIAALLLMGQTKAAKKPEVVKARAFEVVDANGKVVATLDGRDAPGRVELRMLEPDGTSRVVIAAEEKGTVLRLAQTEERSATVLVGEKNAAFQLLEPSRDASVTLGIGEDGAMFGLNDRGTLGATIVVGAKGRGIALYDRAGKPTWVAPPEK
jgi:hypothetical protein